jgi:WD40 repeat protein
VAVTPDGRRAISASVGKTLKVWDLRTGELQHTLAGHSRPVTAVAVTPDGRRAISASDDETLKVWDLRTGELQHTLAGHSAWVWAVAVTPDGRRAISASVDKTLTAWDIASGRAITTFTGDANMGCVAALDDDRIVTGDMLGLIHVIRLIEEKPPVPAGASDEHRRQGLAR